MCANKLIAFLSIFILVQPALSQTDSEFRQWTDSTGEFQVKAKLIDVPPGEGVVVLEKENGETLRVPTERLSPRCKEYLGKLPGTPVPTTPPGKSDVVILPFNPDGKTVKFEFWDVRHGDGEGGNALVFSPDGKTIAITGVENFTGVDKYSREANIREKQLERRYEKNGLIFLIDVATGELRKALTGHKFYVSGIAFSPDGKMIASASSDTTIKLWDTQTGKELRTLTGHKLAVRDVAFSPDGQWIASAGNDNAIKLWNAQSGTERNTLYGHQDSVTKVAFSPDSKWIASGSSDYTIKLWDAETEKELKTLNQHTNTVKNVGFSPDGKMIASASRDSTVKLWDTQTGKLLNTLPINSKIAFSPDGNFFLTRQTLVGPRSSEDARTDGFKLWNVQTGKVVQTLDTGQRINPDLDFTFSPDGQWIAAIYPTSERNRYKIMVWSATK